MSQARTSSRFISIAVVVALVAVTALMTCGVAFGAPMSGGPAPDSGACGLDSHGSMGEAAVSAEAPKIVVELHAVLPAAPLVGISQQAVSRGAYVVAVELPPPSDPRHGRTRL